jgi:hypothetical protein
LADALYDTFSAFDIQIKQIYDMPEMPYFIRHSSSDFRGIQMEFLEFLEFFGIFWNFWNFLPKKSIFGIHDTKFFPCLAPRLNPVILQSFFAQQQMSC